MEHLKMHTPDLADENFAKLAALFPNAVTETKDENGNVVRAIDADVLRQEISATVVEGSQERYQFTWPDKKKSVVLANQPIAKTLRLDREKSVGRDGTSHRHGKYLHRGRQSGCTEAAAGNLSRQSEDDLYRSAL